LISVELVLMDASEASGQKPPDCFWLQRWDKAARGQDFPADTALHAPACFWQPPTTKKIKRGISTKKVQSHA